MLPNTAMSVHELTNKIFLGLGKAMQWRQPAGSTELSPHMGQLWDYYVADTVISKS
jgi:hypothetical protein